jgi:hypothetical protein
MLLPTRLKALAMQDPESPLSENAPESLLVGITGHSLNSSNSFSIYCWEKDDTLFALTMVVSVAAPFLKTTRHGSPALSHMGCWMRMAFGIWSLSFTRQLAGNLKEEMVV